LATSAPVIPLAEPIAVAGRKLQSLEGLRAIAIIAVFFHHLKDNIPVLNLPTLYLRYYVEQGWMGVDLFFVLSGFLITGILIDTREASNYFSGFYARRILRIFPLYYAVLTTIMVAGRLINIPAVTSTLPLPADRWLYFCYLTNWLGLWKAHWSTNYLAHFWSLAVEEQFYFFWPLVVWLLRPRAVPWVAGALAVFSALFRLAWVMHSGPQQAIAIATITRMDALFIGALCAYLFRNAELMLRIRKWLPWVASLGVGSFFLIFSLMLFFPVRAERLLYGLAPGPHTMEDAVELFTQCGGFTLLALGFGAIVLLAAYDEARKTWMQRFLSSRVLAPIGKYSYGIYVFHVPIIGAAAIFLIPRLGAVHTVAEGAISQCAYIFVLGIITFIVSALSYELFEKKILTFKRYFGAKHAPAPNGD
jgi:peptidoglycan/LPS O-acetylase OafA/YrhL